MRSVLQSELERSGRELDPQILLGIVIYKITGLDRCPTAPLNLFREFDLAGVWLLKRMAAIARV